MQLAPFRSFLEDQRARRRSFHIPLIVRQDQTASKLSSPCNMQDDDAQVKSKAFRRILRSRDIAFRRLRLGGSLDSSKPVATRQHMVAFEVLRASSVSSNERDSWPASSAISRAAIKMASSKR